MYQKRKKFMTYNERIFYNKLIELEDEYNLKIQPQINLATIIKKKNNNYYKRVNELFRNIDFGIFSKNYNDLLLLIELNDKSHNKKERKLRDEKVKDIVKEAGIKLITFHTNFPNKEEYVKNRILKEINIQR